MDRVAATVTAALRMVEEADHDIEERIAMLVELARQLRDRPRRREDLLAARRLLERALELAGSGRPLAAARVRVQLAAVLRELPDGGIAALEAARDLLVEARPVLEREGDAEERADLDMLLGVVLHALANSGRVALREAVAAYQRALRVFDRERHPREFALLQNNLATAFLAMAFADTAGGMREALAVQCFEAGLAALDPRAHPREWAMLQNNLGNALQSVRSGHPLANRLRALEAYRAALRVRDRERAPVEYANTVANLAQCLLALPDDPERPEAGNPRRRREAARLLAEAHALFTAHGETARAAAVAELLDELREVRARGNGAAEDPPPNGDGGGMS